MSTEHLRAADRRRIGVVVETHRSLVEAVARQHVSALDVPDLVQEVSLRICERLNGLRNPGAIRGWILRVTVNTAKSVHRSRLAERAALERFAHAWRDDEHIEDPDGIVLEGERLKRLMGAIAQLRTTDQAVAARVLADQGQPGDDAQRQRRRRMRRRLRLILEGTP